MDISSHPQFQPTVDRYCEVDDETEDTDIDEAIQLIATDCEISIDTVREAVLNEAVEQLLNALEDEQEDLPHQHYPDLRP